MIRNCANPNCDAEFRYSYEGRLFPYEIRNPAQPCRDVPAVICEKKPGHATVYFWLCGPCCDRLTLQFTLRTGVNLVPVCREKAVDRKTTSRPSAASETGSFMRRHA